MDKVKPPQSRKLQRLPCAAYLSGKILGQSPERVESFKSVYASELAGADPNYTEKFKRSST